MVLLGWTKHPRARIEKVPWGVWDLRHCLLWQVIINMNISSIDTGSINNVINYLCSQCTSFSGQLPRCPTYCSSWRRPLRVENCSPLSDNLESYIVRRFIQFLIWSICFVWSRDHGAMLFTKMFWICVLNWERLIWIVKDLCKDFTEQLTSHLSRVWYTSLVMHVENN